MVSVYIKQDEVYSAPLEYILAVLGRNKKISLEFSKSSNGAAVIFDHTNPASLPVNISAFRQLLEDRVYQHSTFFKEKPHWTFPETNQPDWLGTAFYMINSFQEY